MSFDSSAVRINPNYVEFDPIKVFEAISNTFEEWHSPPGKELLGLSEPRSDWHLLLESYDTFVSAATVKNVPVELVNTLWDALRSTQGKLDSKVDGVTVREIFKNELKDDPTKEQFRDACAKGFKGKGKAGGLSGNTYAIIALWPAKLADLVYDLIVKIRSNGCHPSGWQHKWLAILPKVRGEVSLCDVRPLTLLECVRKVWTSVRVKKAWWLMEKHGMLHTAQHGYRRHRSTSSITVQLINVFEEAEESATIIAASSFDYKKAFDSLARMISMLSLYRGGVPKDACEDMILIDEGAFTYIKTGHSKDHWQNAIYNSGAEGYTNLSKEHYSPFHMIRGVGQGDDKSCLTWDCFMDILIVALDKSDVDKFYVRQTDGSLAAANEKVYADDLIAISPNEKALQKKEDIVSALCLMFDININIKKLRLFLLQYGDKSGYGTKTYYSNQHVGKHRPS